MSFAKIFVLLVFPRQLGIGARLTIGVAEMLVSGEEPQSIADHRPTQAGRDVTVPRSLVAAVQLSCRVVRASHRLARERSGLPVVGRIELKAATARLADHVHDSTLDVAVLDRRAHALDLQFLNEVDAWLGPRDAVARRGDTRAIEEILVLIDAGPEGGDEGAVA